MRSRHAGFTLIEVMVVVIILGVLAAMIVPRIMDQPDKARITKAQADLRAIESALKLFRLDNFQYPTTDQGLEGLVSKPSAPPAPSNWKEGGYLDRLAEDPWGRPYQYLSPGTHGDFDLYSLGPDGEPSEDDLGNWDL